MVRFSLVLGTIGNPIELKNFLEHLDKQINRSFELIVVDQSPDESLIPVLSDYHDHFPIRYLKSDIGLSIARNTAIPYASGEVIAFPDDDCWYPPGLLQNLSQRFDSELSVDGYTGRTVDENGNSIIRFASKRGYLTKINAWQRVNSSSMFFRAKAIQNIGKFDEGLGPGSSTSMDSADDVDYVIRCVELGLRLYFDPDIVVFHADHRRNGYKKLYGRSFQYGAGIGRVWRKHDFPFWYVGYHLLRPLAGVFTSYLSGDPAKARYHWLSLLGRYSGWRSKL